MPFEGSPIDFIFCLLAECNFQRI